MDRDTLARERRERLRIIGRIGVRLGFREIALCRLGGSFRLASLNEWLHPLETPVLAEALAQPAGECLVFLERNLRAVPDAGIAERQDMSFDAFAPSPVAPPASGAGEAAAAVAQGDGSHSTPNHGGHE